MNKLFLFLSVCLLIGSNCSHAQFSLVGELRLRPEMRFGYKCFPDSNSTPALFISQRSRLSLAYTKDKLAVGLAMQDVRTWGDELNYSSTGVVGDEASIDLKEAWIRLQLTNHIFIKAGRQELKYDDQRLLAARNWNQHGLSYDAVVISFQKNMQLDAGLSLNNSGESNFMDYYSPDKIKMLNFIYFGKQWADKIETNALYIQAGYQHPENPGWQYIKHTLGFSGKLSAGEPYLYVSAYYQDGRNKTGREVSAWLLNAIAGLKTKHYHTLAGIDLISGQNSVSTDPSYLATDHAFDILYGARHSKNGAMDYFSNLGRGTGNAGLLDVYLAEKATFSNGLSFGVDFHYFRLQTDLAGEPDLSGNTQSLNRYLAVEADFLLGYSINKDMQLEIGYSFLSGSETLCVIQDVSYDMHHHGHWIYMMLTVKPTFFKTD